MALKLFNFEIAEEVSISSKTSDRFSDYSCWAKDEKEAEIMLKESFKDLNQTDEKEEFIGDIKLIK